MELAITGTDVRSGCAAKGEGAAPPVRLHQLDGLRALAVSLVVIHHVGAANLAVSLRDRGYHYLGDLVSGATASGVELFFVLSGIVLLRPYFRANRPMDVGRYLYRRAQRLWPAYLVAWVVSAAVVWLITNFPTWWTLGSQLPAFRFDSWLAQCGIVYVGRYTCNRAWWSLSVEIFFYLLVPILVVILRRARLSPGGAVAIYAGSVAISIVAANGGLGAMLLYAWPIQQFLEYLPCFAAGLLLAKRDMPVRWGRIAIGVGCLYVLAALHYPAMNRHAAWGLLYAGVACDVLGNASTLSVWFRRWWCVWLGERSYSLFLIHYAIINAVCHLVAMMTPHKALPYFVVTRALEVPLSLLAAMLLFHFVERRCARGLVTAESSWPVPSSNGSDAFPGRRARLQARGA